MNGLSSVKNITLDAEAYLLLEALSLALSAPDQFDIQTIIENGLRLCSLLLVPSNMAVAIDSSTPLSPWKENKAKELIASKLSEHMSIAAIAKECSLSRSHFSRAFKQNTGLSPKEWLTNSRIQRSQEMLLLGCLPIAQIGIECGFSDQSHFTRVFNKCVGMTPSRWRRTELSTKYLAAT